MSRIGRRVGRGAAGASGFTLLEVLAVVALLAIVFVFAIDFYLDLSRASNEAATRTRSLRRAVALLDRVARDLEATVLVRKPADVDPLEHPWVFLADARDGDTGADHLKLVTRGNRPRSAKAVESDLQLVAWILEPADSGDFELLRWSSPHLPSGLDRSFPRRDDDGVHLVADGIASFGVRLLGETGGWQGRWDSSVLLDSSELPLAAEITVSFRSETNGADEFEENVDGPYERSVLLPLRPLDLEALLDAATEQAGGQQQEAGGEESDCITVEQCIAQHPELLRGLDEPAQRSIASQAGACASKFRDLVPVPADCQ